jgi:hypothetical protein
VSFEAIKKQFDACFTDAAIFQRDRSGGAFFEFDKLRKNKQDWTVVAAGVSDSLAKDFFPNNSGRQERAAIPVNIMGGGQLTFAFVLRAIDKLELSESNAEFMTTFAPKRGVPFVQLQDSFLRLSNLPENGSGLTHLRWELDSSNAFTQPQEPWLHHWKDVFGFNPAHPPSHVHINQTPIEDYESSREARTHSPADLRLAVGVPNPLAIILSLATWKRRAM